MSQPTIGRVVHLTLNASDAEQINRRRFDAQQHLIEHREAASGVQIHVGNSVTAGDVFPMVITRVWNGNAVNGQVLLDGNDLFWATSRCEGEGPGTWAWPARV